MQRSISDQSQDQIIEVIREYLLKEKQILEFFIIIAQNEYDFSLVEENRTLMELNRMAKSKI
jgi:hypothetical protein